MEFKLKLLDNLLFLDIETVRLQKDFSKLDDRLQHHWKKKAKRINSNQDIGFEESYQDRAGIYAEFGKVICISIGALERKGNDILRLKLKSFYGHDEKQLLSSFIDLLNQHYDSPEKYKICGHNIREFDVPYIARRCMILGIELPKMFKLMGKKPWQVGHIVDTMELWKFGDYKNYTSLDLLCHTLNIDSPKDGISGADVGRAYYEDEALEEIKLYCEKDVLAVANVFLKFLKSSGVKFNYTKGFCR